MDTEISLPPDLESRIRKLNEEYLTLAQALARSYPLAAPLLGVPQELVDILDVTPVSRFRQLISTEMLLVVPRITDIDIWRKAATGVIDAHALLHATLRATPAEMA